MGRLIWFTFLALTTPLTAQDLPDGVKRTVDSFTGDTVWETKYGRLDESQGCGRRDLAIVWQLRRGPTGRAEALFVQYNDVQRPFHRVHSIGMTAATVNVDGRFIEAPLRPLSTQRNYDKTLNPNPGHIDTTAASNVEERATFVLPDSTLRLVADAQVARLRVVGAASTCAGIVEQNMKDRLHSLLQATR